MVGLNMVNRVVIFLHGFASSGKGTKGQYLQQKFAGLPTVDFYAFEFSPTPTDFEYMTVTGMIDRLRQFVLDRGIERLQLIGSSMGGLVGIHYAHRYGGVEKMLLLAPALVYLSGLRTTEESDEWRRQGVGRIFHYAFNQEVRLRYDLEIDGARYTEVPRPAAPVTIVHGRSDGVVPIARSRDYAAEYPELVELIEVDAGHDLNGHLDLIWEQVTGSLLE